MKINAKAKCISWITFVVIAFQIFLPAPQIRANAESESNWEPTSLQKTGLTSIKVTPYGLLVGQNSTQYWENPYNGVYFSGDFGETWVQLGLEGRRITDIAASENFIFAATPGAMPNYLGGICNTANYGSTWQCSGKEFVPTKLEMHQDKLYIGTKYEGLWTIDIHDNKWQNFSVCGTTYQKQITEIQKDENLIIIRTPNCLEYSTNLGTDFKQFDYFKNNGIIPHSVFLDEGIIFAGTTSKGIVISQDKGKTWQETNKLKGQLITKIGRAGNSLFVASKSNPMADYKVYTSEDQGNTWHDTKIEEVVKTQKINGLDEMVGITHSTLLAATEKGLYKLGVDNALKKEPFLGKLWKDQEKKDLVDSMTAFFDHEYPLLGHTAFPEPVAVSNSTVNFLGQRGKEPIIYYSSHNGYDFGLSYGTEIKAPAAGIASYYYCKDCGHSIKINHQNGYETTYMHLQKEDLLTKNTGANKKVKEGDTIGKIGMTGRTTGPHLHFSIKKDTNKDGSFSDEYPRGLTDPFGWRNSRKWDPWPFFAWETYAGIHQGTHSKYLWKESWNSWEVIEVFKNNPVLMSLGNIKIESSRQIKPYPINLKLQKFPQIQNNELTYIKDTSFSIEGQKFDGDLIHNLDEPINIKINLTNKISENIQKDTISLYHLNEETGAWEHLPTTLHANEDTLEAQTHKISRFAAFGEKTTSPNTNSVEVEIVLLGLKEKGWFLEHPLVTIAEKPGDRVYYSTDGNYWERYTEPFYLKQEGILALRYNNWNTSTETRSKLIRINTQNILHKTLKFNGSSFSVK